MSGRMLFILSGISLFAILFFPLWQIQLSAPQYPEGLVLLIFPNKLGGNVDIINGLNHYIGMKSLHAADFLEFTILPYIICFFSLLFITAGVIGKRKLTNLAFILFVCFGIIAMADFWKWEYNYGHTLNPDAAIIVPGMSYQPPLIGFKQLLNFGAYSIPDVGGWVFVCVGIILLFVILKEWIHLKKTRNLPNPASAFAIFMLTFFFASCHANPAPLVLGRDNCQFCKMTISDARFGAEIITQKGKIFKFDDPQCAISFLLANQLTGAGIQDIYFTDFSDAHALIPSKNTVFLKSESLSAPMGGHFIAFNNPDSLKEIMKKYPGSIVYWQDVFKP
jgi:copper chaperone NosL